MASGPQICTFFEGHYHYGAGALVNSLVRNGFAGTVWIGYRGSLPPWAKPGSSRAEVTTHEASTSLTIKFVRLNTSAALTNYKPTFMLRVMDELAPEAPSVFFFDPDIAVKCNWQFFTEWAACGVALCEDVNSPISENHPLRWKWRAFGAERHLGDAKAISAYFNAGFVGVERTNREFLALWAQIVAWMGEEIGGLEKMVVGDRTHRFNKVDQDALNIAAMYTHAPLSTVGKEGMDFTQGGWIMAHAIGSPKPWRKSLVWQALMGRRPSSADRLYWANVSHPIPLYSRTELQIRRFNLKFAAALGRYLG